MSEEKLVEKFLENKCTPEEAKAVLAWLSSPEGQLFAKERFDKDATLMGSDSQKFDEPSIRSVQMYQQVLQKINSQNVIRVPKTHLLSWIKIAAAVFIPLIIFNATIWLMIEKTSEKITWQEVNVKKEEKLQVMFQDGSRVWLNSDSKLKYPVDFVGNQREVKLEGEAYFTVKKDPKKPFLIHLNNLDIRVTGTSFNVKAYKDEEKIAVSLDEGKIFLQTHVNNTITEYEVNPGHEAIFSKKNAQVSIRPALTKRNSLWKENKISFVDCPYEEAIKVLERWYNIKFVTEGPKIPNYSYTINFNNEPIQNVLFGLEKLTPIKCELRDGVVYVRKRKIE